MCVCVWGGGVRGGGSCASSSTRFMYTSTPMIRPSTRMSSWSYNHTILCAYFVGTCRKGRGNVGAKEDVMYTPEFPAVQSLRATLEDGTLLPPSTPTAPAQYCQCTRARQQCSLHTCGGQVNKSAPMAILHCCPGARWAAKTLKDSSAGWACLPCCHLAQHMRSGMCTRVCARPRQHVATPTERQRG